MFGIGSQELTVIGLIIFILAIISALRKKGNISISGPTLVLRKYQIKKTPTSDTDEIINIIGRTGGIFAWIFTLIGLETEYFLKVTAREIRIKKSSLFGQQHITVPLTSVSSVHCGYLKPIGYLIIGVVIILSGLYIWLFEDEGFSYFLGSLFAGAILFVLYWLLKKIEILIHTRGGLPLGLVFKRSVIENVPVDIECAKLTIEIINNLIIKSQAKEIEVNNVVTESETIIQQQTMKTAFCASCGSPLEEGSKFCAVCGRSI